jgi:UDP-3-O-[3-hydroxymyristoyl] glucosamine N-acyltransferase
LYPSSGSVIGADGFGFAPNPDGTKNPSNRECNEDDVDIGACTTLSIELQWGQQL